MQEQNEIAEEIANAISQPIGFAAELDDVSSKSFSYSRILSKNSSLTVSRKFVTWSQIELE